MEYNINSGFSVVNSFSASHFDQYKYDNLSSMADSGMSNQKTIYINPKMSQSKPNVHINPLFRNAHINPLFKRNSNKLNVQKPTNVHVNPKIFQQLTKKVEINTNDFTSAAKSEPMLGNDITNTKSQYLFISNRKLIKNKPQTNQKCDLADIVKHTKSEILQAQISTVYKDNIVNLKFPSRDKLKKVQYQPNRSGERPTNQRIRRTSLKSMYKVVHTKKKLGAVKKYIEKSKYKVDHRLNKSLRSKYNFRKNLVPITPPKFKIDRAHKKSAIPNRQLINIGGVLYKSTKLKLCRTKDESKTITSVKKLNKCIITVQGAKYVLDQNAKTLKKIFDSEKTKHSPLKRINIGGITYISKNETTLIRTSKPRSLIQSNNKHCGNMRKNNMVCLLYQRYGYCKRNNMGKCSKVHDEKRVGMCKSYLRGSCTKSACKLSHKPSLEKMPVCLHFLSGTCVRDDCLYLHVKHNESVPVCDQFLQGYCALAEKCTRRHEFICPNFDKHGKCMKVKCSLPHKVKSKPSVILKMNKVKSNIISKEENKRYYQENRNENKQREDSKVRYYEDGGDESNKDKVSLHLCQNVDEVSTEICANNENEVKKVSLDDDVECNGKRPKLGILPAYIPL